MMCRESTGGTAGVAVARVPGDPVQPQRARALAARLPPRLLLLVFHVHTRALPPIALAAACAPLGCRCERVGGGGRAASRLAPGGVRVCVRGRGADRGQPLRSRGRSHRRGSQAGRQAVPCDACSPRWWVGPYSWCWCGGCQALGVPWAVCQPYPPPRPAPSGLLQAFRMAHPDLYSALNNTTDPQQDDQQQQGDGGGALGVWDLEHWLWPIFSDSWLNLRQRWASTTSQHRHRQCHGSDVGWHAVVASGWVWVRWRACPVPPCRCSTSTARSSCPSQPTGQVRKDCSLILLLCLVEEEQEGSAGWLSWWWCCVWVVTPRPRACAGLPHTATTPPASAPAPSRPPAAAAARR